MNICGDIAHLPIAWTKALNALEKKQLLICRPGLVEDGEGQTVHNAVLVCVLMRVQFYAGREAVTAQLETRTLGTADADASRCISLTVAAHAPLILPTRRNEALSTHVSHLALSMCWISFS
jgi:hypothetical protein